MAIAFETRPVAKKSHECRICKQEIPPGQRYVRVAWPAWEDYEADVDEYGRTFGYLRSPEDRRWEIEKYHEDCLMDQRY